MSEPKVRNILFQLISQLCTWKRKKCMRKFYFAPYFLHYRLLLVLTWLHHMYLLWPGHIRCLFPDLVTWSLTWLHNMYLLWPGHITCPFPDLVTWSLTWLHHMYLLWPGHITCLFPDLVTWSLTWLHHMYLLWPGHITCQFSDLVTSHAKSLT